MARLRSRKNRPSARLWLANGCLLKRKVAFNQICSHLLAALRAKVMGNFICFTKGCARGLASPCATNMSGLRPFETDTKRDSKCQPCLVAVPGACAPQKIVRAL